MPTQYNLSPLLSKISWQEVSGWQHDSHLAALNCFRQSAKRILQKSYTTKSLGITSSNFQPIAMAASTQKFTDDAAAKNFFEKHFTPYRFDAPPFDGLLTGYFEPQIEASRQKTDIFRFPIYARPDDLIDINDTTRPDDLPDSFMFARKKGGKIIEYYDRRQIQDGVLNDRQLELFWLADPVDIFFIHIQGSAHLLLDDGSQARIAYAAKTGHPYTPIGKTLVERGELELSQVNMQSIRNWLHNNPRQQKELMAQNRSYIFFREILQPDPALGPIAAAGVPLSAGRSLAVDHRLHTFSTPIWVESSKRSFDSENALARLFIAQDTGSAIVGKQRGDIFIGTGKNAGEIAGKINLPVSMTVLVPNQN